MSQSAARAAGSALADHEAEVAAARDAHDARLGGRGERAHDLERRSGILRQRAAERRAQLLDGGLRAHGTVLQRAEVLAREPRGLAQQLLQVGVVAHASTLRGDTPLVPRPLRVGIQLPEVEREVRWPEYVAMARAAEEAGFDSIWLGDHLLYRGDGRPERGPWDGWTMLAGLAAATERVHLGPLVACTAFHEPGLLARTAAAVDEISGGRLVFGIGAGWNEAEFRAFGIPFDRRVSRFEEAFEIVRRLLDGERVTFEGRFHRVEDARAAAAARAAHAADDRRDRAAHALDRAAARARLEHLVRQVRQHARGLRSS